MYGVIFCAGFGKRLRPYTEHLPKPAIPFLNIPQWAHSLYFLEKLEVKKIALNTHYLPKKMAESIQAVKTTIPLRLFDEQPEILGSGGGLYNMKDCLLDQPDTVVVFNGDSIRFFKQEETLVQAYEQHKSSGAAISFVVMPHPEAGKGLSALWGDENNNLTALGKNLESPQWRAYHFPGVYFVEPELFSHLQPGFSNILTEVVMPIVGKMKVKLIPIDNMYFGETGNIKNYLSTTEFALNQLIEKGPFSQNIKHLLERFTPEYQLKTNAEAFNQTQLKGHCLIEKDFPVESPPEYTEGFLVVAQGARLHKVTSLNNIVLGPKVLVDTQQSLSQDLILTP